MSERALFVCNTPFQVFVACWIKHRYLKDIKADISVSDHMNGGEKLCKNICEAGLFDRVFYSKTLDLDNWKLPDNYIKERIHTLFPEKYLKKFTNMTDFDYSRIYFSNINLFPLWIYRAACRKQKSNPRLFVFEDGLSTYTEFTVKKYNTYKTESYNGVKNFLHQTIYKDAGFYGNIESVLVFNPELVTWDILPIQRLDKVDVNDSSFKEKINTVFQYNKSVDTYDKKVVFFEESFYADGHAVNDVELVEQIAKKIGKDNIMVKIHPRNPDNRFAELGFKTNKDISIPWEVIVLNLEDVSDKVFITILSGSITNPILIFGKKIHAFSLYNLINKETIDKITMYNDILSFMVKVYGSYPEMIKFIDSVDEIEI